jgi:hypothetical protein
MKKSCWKISDSSDGLRMPISKGGHLTVCHTGSEATGLIPERKLIFSSRSNDSTQHHSEINSAMFQKVTIEWVGFASYF